jgi:hypothetical protein
VVGRRMRMQWRIPVRAPPTADGVFIDWIGGGGHPERFACSAHAQSSLDRLLPDGLRAPLDMSSSAQDQLRS